MVWLDKSISNIHRRFRWLSSWAIGEERWRRAETPSRRS
jgi:hypothetical protein